jgi:hypothetical protein
MLSSLNKPDKTTVENVVRSLDIIVLSAKSPADRSTRLATNWLKKTIRRPTHLKPVVV